MAKWLSNRGLLKERAVWITLPRTMGRVVPCSAERVLLLSCNARVFIQMPQGFAVHISFQYCFNTELPSRHKKHKVVVRKRYGPFRPLVSDNDNNESIYSTPMHGHEAMGGGRVQTGITGPWAGQRAKQLSEIELDSSKAKPQILIKLASHKEACVSGSKVRSKRQRRAQPL